MSIIEEGGQKQVRMAHLAVVGSCSGLSPRAYFDTVRTARAMVKIPADYLDVKTPLTVSPADVEEAFVAANAGLTREAVAVTCDAQRVREVRLCLSKEFKFRDCPEIDHRACRRDRLVLPPVRGG